MIYWSSENISSSWQPWYVCLIFWIPNYCRHPSSSTFSSSLRCCPTWFWNVMQGVLYPYTWSTPCLSNAFCRKYWGCHFPYFVQTNFLLVKLVHAQNSCYYSPNNEELIDDSWDIFLPSCVVVNQIRFEFLTCIGALFQEDVCKVPFLWVCLNFNLLIIGNVLINCAVCGMCSPFRNNWMVSCESNGGYNINLGVK